MTFTFTNKISNLLFPLGAEGAGGRESYPTNDIPNKHIYDAFLIPSGLQKRSQMAIIDYV